MDEEHRSALERSLNDICRDLDADDILPYLRSKGIVKEEQAHEIMKTARKSMQNMQLVDLIKGAGPSAFQEFINALQTCNKECLTEKILAHLPSSSTQHLSLPEMNITYSQDNKHNQGHMITGGNFDKATFNQHIYHGAPLASQESSTSSAASESIKENLPKIIESIKKSLKDSYVARFKSIQPMSSFTFDIENIWVPLTLKEDFKHSQATEDHAKLLESAFKKAKMLIIEGDPATGKTSLMQRLAYEWATEKPEMLCYDIVIYAEFREVHAQTFERITDLVLECAKNYLHEKDYVNLEKLVKSEHYYVGRNILMLLDGFDESSTKEPCSELCNYLIGHMIGKPLLFNIVITTRKGILSSLREFKGRFVYANVLGFETEAQKEKYIHSHFFSTSDTDDERKKENETAAQKVKSLLKKNDHLTELSKTPLFLTFICLVHEKIIVDSSAETLLGLYCNILWYILDRYQKKNPENNVPVLFGFQSKPEKHVCARESIVESLNKSIIIKDNYFHFPQLHYLGHMALHNIEKSAFSCDDLTNFNVEEIVEKVGLIRKGESSGTIEFFFAHRSIQEFLAAFSFFFSCGKISYDILESKFFQNVSQVNEFRTFLRLFAETKTIPVEPTRQQEYLKQSETWSFPHVKAQLLDLYLSRFHEIHPFSLPFTYDIEKTWVSLALKEENMNYQTTEDHAKLLKRAFNKVKILIIEGDPATGKTSLMQRLACEWARGKKELLCYDLVLYIEFRAVRERTFETIAELVLYYSKTSLVTGNYENLKKLLNSELYCKKHRILVLLDGYDESLLEEQCLELTTQLFEKEIVKPLLFHVVMTTRRGYLSRNLRLEGRCAFAEVLGFVTMEQKEKFISNHFLLTEIDRKENIAAVRRLLFNNENLNKLAEIPLFLTFMCLMHERIIDGTVVELYYNMIWWLVDRHQKDFPVLDIPSLFGFQSNSKDKFSTIQSHFLQFPQILHLGKMALHNLKNDVFKKSDIEEFNLKPILQQVGLLRKEKLSNRTTKYSFTHRTIQEFLAALYCFCSDESTNTWLLPNSKIHTSNMNEFEKLLLRIALSDEIPIQAEKREYYFKRITDIDLDITFDAFNTTAGFNNKLLNWFLSQCTNVQNIQLSRTLESSWLNSEVLKQILVPTIVYPIPSHIIRLFLYYGVVEPSYSLLNAVRKRYSLAFTKCIVVANSQLSFTNCPYLKNLKFSLCEIKSGTNLNIAVLSAIHTVEFSGCTFEGNSQLSFTDCSSLKNLKFNKCEIKSSTIVGIAALPAIDTVLFDECIIDMATWQSITAQNINSSVRCLKLTFGEEFNKEFLIHLQKYKNIEQMDITMHNYNIRQNNLLSFRDLTKLHSLTFGSDVSGCTFSANSQLSFTNCSSLKKLIFRDCEMISIMFGGIATLPAIDTVEFDGCRIDLATWQSITDQISNSNVKYLKLRFEEDFSRKFLIHLQQCNNVEKMDITIQGYTIRQNDLISFSHLIKLHSLTFGGYNPRKECTFSTNSQLLFTNCPSLKNLLFHHCETRNSTIVGLAALPAIDTVEFYQCNIDLATWQSVTDQIMNSTVKYLYLSTDFFVKQSYPEFLNHLQKCERIQQIHINDVRDSEYKYYILNCNESVTGNLALTAQKLPALASITISDAWGRRLSKGNRERIEKAGRERDSHFSIGYVQKNRSALEE